MARKHLQKSFRLRFEKRKMRETVWSAFGIIAIILLAILASIVHTRGQSAELLASLARVESADNDYAIGDRHLKHPAYGALQIREPVVLDYNRAHKTAYHASDCLGNRELSEKLCRWYTSHYATKELLGHVPMDEDRARIWNGGPAGWKMFSTKAYWKKVKKFLA